jgi:hypothetical protein
VVPREDFVITALALALVLAQQPTPTQVCDDRGNCAGVTGGGLNINGSISASTSANASASPPTYSPGAQPLSQDLNGNLRVAGTFSASPPASVVSATNSSTAALGANGTYTGTGVSILPYGAVIVSVYSNVSSATDGVQIQFSQDNTNWNDSVTATYTAGGPAPNDGQVYGANARGQYVRVVYKNGGSAQSTFRIQTILSVTNTTGDTIDVAEVLGAYNHATVTKGVIVGKTTGGGGGYVDVKVNPSGTLTVDASGTTVPVSIAGSVPVTGTFWQATQPVSGTFWQATQPVSIATMPSTPVTGTFWQATQPVSGPLTDTQLRASPVPITGSLSLAGSNTPSDSFANPTNASPGQSFLMGWNGSTWDRIASEGTNTDAEAVRTTGAMSTEAYNMIFNGTTWDRARGDTTSGAWVNVKNSSIPVTGTFWQATQPVSIAASVPVTGTFWQATQPVSIATMPSTPVTGTFWQATQPVSGTVTAAQATAANLNATVVQPTAANLNATVVGPTLTKGTQGTTGFSVQRLIDAGRTSRMFTATAASTATTETLITLTYSNGLAATSTCSSCAVTSGKTLKIQDIAGCIRTSTGTNAHTVTINLRANAAGATTASSPLQIHAVQSNAASSTTCTPLNFIDLPDGFDIPYGSGATFGITITDPGWVTGAQVSTVELSIIAFEY